MKPGLVKSVLTEEPALPERLTADGIVKFARLLWRQAKAFHGGPVGLFSMTIETKGWNASVKSGRAAPYYAGGAASVRGTLSVVAVNLDAVLRRQGPLADPRTAQALELIRGVLAGAPRAQDDDVRHCARVRCKAQALLGGDFCGPHQGEEDKDGGAR